MNEQLHLNFGDFKLMRAGHQEFDEERQRWLIDGVWFTGGTGMLAGMPKTGKTWTAIDAAVSVASGTPFLGQFDTRRGPVILYSPEGPPAELDDRIRQVAARRGLDHRDLEIYTLAADEVFLNSPYDQEKISEMFRHILPALAIFDPLVECFSGDENRSDDVNTMTRFLVRLARENSTGVMVTHHMVKTGKSMRGNGALLGFGDSYLFMEKKITGPVTLSFVQRHGTPAPPCTLELTTVDGDTCYHVAGSAADMELQDLGERILDFLKSQTEPLSQRAIREQVGGDYHKYPETLRKLKAAEEIDQDEAGRWKFRPDDNEPDAGKPPESPQKEEGTPAGPDAGKPPESPQKEEGTSAGSNPAEDTATPPPGGNLEQ